MTLADFAHSVLMHPVRLRLVQRLALLGTATVQELAAALPDIPRASLYRHLRTLTELGYLTVVEETRVRGTVERTYALTDNPADEKLGKPARPADEGGAAPDAARPADKPHRGGGAVSGGG